MINDVHSENKASVEHVFYMSLTVEKLLFKVKIQIKVLEYVKFFYVKNPANYNHTAKFYISNSEKV